MCHVGCIIMQYIICSKLYVCVKCGFRTNWIFLLVPKNLAQQHSLYRHAAHMKGAGHTE